MTVPGKMCGGKFGDWQRAIAAFLAEMVFGGHLTADPSEHARSKCKKSWPFIT
jgi:hypothetical protein